MWSDGRKSELKETETVTGLFTDDAGQLVPKTLTTSYAYEDEDPNTPLANDGLLRKITDPLGHSTRFSYDSQGNVLAVTDSLGHSTTNSYYPGTNLLHTTEDALHHVTTYTYDVRGQLDTEARSVTVVDENGNTLHQSLVTDHDFDAQGFLTRMVDPAGHVTTYDNDAQGNRLFERTTRTDSQGHLVPVVTEHEYDANSRLVRSWDAEHPRAAGNGPTSETVYDELGKVSVVYDALRRTTQMTYNDRGELVSTLYPDGTSDSVQYDADGRREYTTDRRGKTMQTVYDAVGRAVGMIFLGSQGDAPVTLSSTSYDSAGRVYQSTDANQHTTTSVYDSAGRRTASIDPLGQRTTFEYDDGGNLRFATDAKGHTTEHIYDELNRRTSTILPAADLDLNGDGTIGAGEANVVSSTTTTYDELGRRVAETDAAGRTKRFVYDALGRLTHVVEPAPAGQDATQITSYTYDELGNQLTQTDANQHTTTYAYDSLGRRVSRTLPLGQTESMLYSLAGTLTRRMDFNGTVTSYAYDALNRLLSRTAVQTAANITAANVSFTYTASGQRETMTDASGVTTYGYDSRDRLVSKATPQGTLSYTYDDAGNLTSITSSNANGTAVTYRHDELNRLSQVEENGNEITRYGYDAVGNLDHFRTPNGITHTYTYNALNRLTDLSVSLGQSTLASYAYTQLVTGHRSAAIESFSSGTGILPVNRSSRYTYDSLYRLTQETLTTSTGPAGTVGYGLDPVGNRNTRTSSIPGLPSQTFNYDANDRLTSDQYDANGNTTTDHVALNAAGADQPPQSTTDTYDSENRLIARTGPHSVQIVYDGDGNKVRETVDGQTISYLIDTLNPTGYAQVVEELQNGTVIRTYTFGHDLLLQDQRDGTGAWRATWYGYDGHGSVRFLTDGAGQITDRYDYDAFGTLLATSGTTDNRYRYCGEQYDSGLGLYYLRARFMNAAGGRFWSMDSFQGTLLDPLSLHRFIYCGGEPNLGSDPSGQYTLTQIMSAVGIVSNFVFLCIDLSKWGKSVYAGETEQSVADASCVAIDLVLAALPFSGLGGSAVRATSGLLQRASTLPAIRNAQLAWAAIHSLSLAAESEGHFGGGSGGGGGSGPGSWIELDESMSTRAREYQASITGEGRKVYVVKGVKFDGFKNGVLLDAKGPGYASFVKNGRFKDYFEGSTELVKQARRQLAAAGGTPLEWHVAEPEAATAIRNLFAEQGITGIVVR